MNNKINIGDWVKVSKLGINGLYQVESIEDKIYTVIQSEGTYTHRIKLPLKTIKKA
jgi:hypothetical protein|tara:strand:+ start:828 stop:995 length:168 start_codon:yes stop_codon:yes gene_type:complete